MTEALIKMNPPNANKLSRTAQLSIAAVFVLGGAVFFTVNNLQQQQDNRSKAADVNRLSNPGCEGNTNFFKGYQAAISSSTTVKRSGVSSCRVVSTGGTYYDIETLQSAASPQVGQRFTGAAYVRSDTNSGKPVYIALREAGGSTASKTVYGPPVYLSTAWQLVSNTVTVENSGRTSMDFYVVQESAATGQSFYADDMIFQSVTATPATPVPTVMPTRVPTAIPVTPTRSATPVPAGDTQAPAAPTNFRILNYTSSGVWLSWNAATDNVGVQRYNVWRGSKNYDSFVQVSTVQSPTLMYISNDLTPGFTYSFNVRAQDAAGNISTQSNTILVNVPTPTTGITPVLPPPTVGPVTDTQSPTAPTNLRILNYTPSGALLSWNAATDNVGVQRYNIWRGNGNQAAFTQVSSVQSPTLLYTSNDLTPGISYSFKVLAQDVVGNVSAQSNTILVTVSAATVVPPTSVPPTSTTIPTPQPTRTPTLTVAPTAITLTNTPAPTLTPVAGSTTLQATLLLHGLGKGGDSVNANALGNFNLVHPQRTITMQIYDVQNQLVATKQGTVTFNTTAGNFVGTVDLGTQFATGLYTVKIKTDQYLRGLVAGIQTINAGQRTTLASLTLVNGDVNNDNQINIVDYNIVVGCYSDLLPPVSCNAQNEVRADINDDGNVNQFDYNLFIRELTNLGGQ